MTEGLRRRGRLITALGAVAVLLAGGIWWWTNRVPVVQVPDRVCGGAMSGKSVAAILPKKGGEYDEEFQPLFDPPREKLTSWCSMKAANKSILASYSWTTSTSAPAEFLDGMGTPIQLGEAPGYMNAREAMLYLPCRDPSAVEFPRLEVSVSRLAEREVDRQRDPALMAELVADAARYAAQQLNCEVAPRLPAGSPVMVAGAVG
ncbi:hypothetical protein [Streptomyces sp. NBC_01294]|uniref:hypothetical protein n=1 Tax=Streptomyces sp. NBC_01294 TaxID=2903815 RepID=UPI002DD94DC9|nr:hypothetical protein [Streptomyces sp. NBC_01294]WRZ57361.1 hypothetical protein OG534_13230 [Streptomyces sp. NBC_01294]